MNGNSKGQNKPDRRTLTARTIKVSLAVFALIVAYLYALNGRYIHVEDDVFFDKWTETMLFVEKERVVE